FVTSLKVACPSHVSVKPLSTFFIAMPPRHPVFGGRRSLVVSRLVRQGPGACRTRGARSPRLSRLTFRFTLLVPSANRSVAANPPLRGAPQESYPGRIRRPPMVGLTPRGCLCLRRGVDRVGGCGIGGLRRSLVKHRVSFPERPATSTAARGPRT